MIKKYHSKTLEAFTIIELLLVMVVLAVLATVIVTSYPAARKRARDTERINDVKQYANALEVYYGTNDGKYPENNADLDAICNSFGLGSECPKDPNNLSYKYVAVDGGNDFFIYSQMEAQDADGNSGYYIICSNGLFGGMVADPAGQTNCPIATNAPIATPTPVGGVSTPTPTPTGTPSPTPIPTSTVTPTPTASPTPTPVSQWKFLKNIGGLGCGTSHSFSTVMASAFKFKMISGGGGDCRISGGDSSSGHSACMTSGSTGVYFNTNVGKRYAKPLNDCPLDCGEWRQTDSFPIQNINKLRSGVGCNGGETMKIELWYYGW